MLPATAPPYCCLHKVKPCVPKANGDLWVQLGRLNFEASEFARAEQYARRGIALTKAGNDTLQRGWLLLADVSEARGDTEGAAQIRSRWQNARG